MPATPGGQAVIELEHLFQHVAGRCVLEDLSLRVEAGERFAVVGPNGSGKTLLLRLLLGLDQPSAGTVRVLGRQPDRIGHAELLGLRRRIGSVFQGGSLLNDLSVADNVMLPLRERGLSAQAMQRAVRLQMMKLRLDGLENFRPAELSGGLRRQIEMARALITDPELLLWDERFDGMDARADVEISKLLEEHLEVHNMTLVLTSHHARAALRGVDRVAALDAGRLLFVGTPAEMSRRSATDPALSGLLEGHP